MNLALEYLSEQFTALVAKRVNIAAASCPHVAGLGEAGPASATPAAPAASATPPTNPIQTVEHALKGYHFDASVAPELVVAAAEIVDRAGFALDTITGVD